MIDLLLVASAQGMVLYKPKLQPTWRPPIERFIEAVKTGQAVNDADFVKPIGSQGASILKPLSGCKSKGYDTTFQQHEVIRWACKRRPGTDMLATILEFEGDKIKRVGLHEVDETVTRH